MAHKFPNFEMYIRHSFPLWLKIYVILHELTHLALYAIMGYGGDKDFRREVNYQFDYLDFQFCEYTGLNDWVNTKYIYNGYISYTEANILCTENE